jgi:hypothetical protein
MVLLLAAGLLLPALYNGFSLLFSDSPFYYFQTIRVHQELPSYRTILYSLWLAAAWPARSRHLLAGIVAQALLLAVLMWQVARTLVPAASWYRLAGGALLLFVCTAAPWVTSQAMPDVFAPITVLALYLMVTQWQRLTRTGCFVVVFALVVGVGTHTTHMALAAALLLACALVAARGQGRRTLARGVGRGAVAVTVGVGLLLAINYRQYSGAVFLSRNGHAFLLGHLVEAGLAQRLLRDECPHTRYALCAFVDEIIPNANWFLWHPASPFNKIGGFEGSKAEAWRLLTGTLRAYPGAHLVTAVRYTVRQFVAIWSIDGLDSYLDCPYLDPVIRQEHPQLYPYFRAARQQRETLHADALATVHQVAACGAALGSLWVLAAAWWRRSSVARDACVGFQVTVWVALVCNAALCGNLSGVFDRYQARLVWLLPLAVMVGAERLRESGWGP